MAFPTLISRTGTFDNVSETQAVISMPATVNAGDLLIIVFDVNGANNISIDTPSGWSLIANTGNGDTSIVFAKKAAGTEGGGTVTITHADAAGTQTALAQTFRVTNWSGRTPVTDAVKGSSVVVNGTSIDLPNLAPGWGTKDTLWIGVCVAAGVANHVAPPTNFADVQGDNGDVMRIFSGTDENKVSSYDPDSWEVSASIALMAYTIAVEPAQGSGGGGGSGGRGGGGGGGGGGGPGGGGPPGQTRRTIIGQRKLKHRGLIQLF